MKIQILFIIISLVAASGCAGKETQPVESATEGETRNITTSTLGKDITILLNLEEYIVEGRITLDIENNLGRGIFLYGMSGIHPWYIVNVFVEIMENNTWTMLVNSSGYGEGNFDIKVPPLLIKRGGAHHIDWNHVIPAPMNGTYRFGLQYHFTEDDINTQIAYSPEFTINKR